MSYSNLGTWAALPRTARGQPIVLGVDNKGKKLVYVHGHSVIIRDLVDPAISEVYTEHSVDVTVAKYAPSGYYICSGDQHGKVRIWDTINEEHILKAEYEVLGGPIRDIVWSHDSQRILVVGEGRDKFAHVFMMDTGASVKGDITGHTKCINTCDWKPTRPFRIVTGAEDNKVAFYEGPPFKFKCTRGEHTKFVQSVRYAPNGDLFASGGFDGKVCIFDGKECEFVKELGSPAHKGGVYGVSWSPDSKRLLSASGDKSCKVWDVESGDVVAEFVMGTQIEDQQLACLWTSAGVLVSVSLSGFINYLDVDKPGAPSKVVKGHNKPITRMELSPDKSTIYTSGMDGTVTVWNRETGENDRIEGTGHGNQVTAIVIKDDNVYTTGIDDTVKVSLVKNNKKVGSFPISYEGQCISVSTSEPPLVAIGGNDNKTYVYELVGNSLNEVKSLDHRGVVTDVVFSPDGNYLAACDTDRKVIIYCIPSYEKHNKIEWGFHNARINCLAWSPDSQLVASGALDTMIIVWSMKEVNKHIIIKNSHPQSQVKSLAWIDNEHFISAGHDSLIKKWSAKF
ncbi:Actin-interacting protein 1 [Armadillidium nasatum]|uniref:Actin-interacting protein 1 n=1 Tax=Armadillidium nasatum TaxID=96803 RepID=A0A5N5SKW7_9CRUS|nr:Actin-interacting protein 1 [Armadillidium nasatum]